MSGHHPFHQLTKDFSPERLAAIQQKKQVLEKMNLQDLLREALNDMGGELAITAKFPNDLEVSTDALPSL